MFSIQEVLYYRIVTHISPDRAYQAITDDLHLYRSHLYFMVSFYSCDLLNHFSIISLLFLSFSPCQVRVKSFGWLPVDID